MPIAELDITGFSTIFGNGRGSDVSPTGASSPTDSSTDVEKGLAPSTNYLDHSMPSYRLIGGLVEHLPTTPEERLAGRQLYDSFIDNVTAKPNSVDALDNAYYGLLGQHKDKDGKYADYPNKDHHTRIYALSQSIIMRGSRDWTVPTNHEEALQLIEVIRTPTKPRTSI